MVLDPLIFWAGIAGLGLVGAQFALAWALKRRAEHLIDAALFPEREQQKASQNYHVSSTSSQRHP